MPCRGPCGKAKDGTTHHRYSDEDNPSCSLDSGHSGPCSWTSEYKQTTAQAELRRKLLLDAQRTATRDVTMQQLLCSACRVLERTGYDFDENPALSQWWERHKEKDKHGT